MTEMKSMAMAAAKTAALRTDGSVLPTIREFLSVFLCRCLSAVTESLKHSSTKSAMTATMTAVMAVRMSAKSSLSPTVIIPQTVLRFAL